MKRLALCFFSAAVLAIPFHTPAATARPPKAPAKAPVKGSLARDPYLGAIVLDAASGRVLFEEGADAKGYPASVQKLMDLLLILERIERGQLSLRDPVHVSAKAAATPVSNVSLAQNESFTVEEMLYALMIKSANDAAVALAEKVAGTTDDFVDLMNRKAKELSMTSTVFHCVHGLPPARGQQHDVSTARDLSLLCRELILKHPQALHYSSTRERTFRPNAGKRTVRMQNHNHLLGRLEGCDGLKTGYFSQAGFSIAVTATRNGQRVLAVVLDSIDSETRDAKAKELVTKGFAMLGATPAPGRAAKAFAPSGR
jgi:D-alanyl-D-alanine carboxypeptidase (penicillin-binding protein 5/6)